MTQKYGRYGGGRVEKRGQNSYRLRYSLGGEKFAKTITAKNMTEARAVLQSLLGNPQVHVAPSQLSVGDWAGRWIEIGAPGRRRKRVSQRSLERYAQLLRTHVLPTLGKIPLQQLRAPDIDRLYSSLEAEGRIAVGTMQHVHSTLGACLATAVRKTLLAVNPMTQIERVPHADDATGGDQEGGIGEGLTEPDLKALVAGFADSDIYPIVVLAASSGMRRNEILALKWTDLDINKGTIRVERALEQTKAFKIRTKPPKTKRGFRTIDLDRATVDLLVSWKRRLQRVAAGIADHADGVDLSLALPPGALMFPSLYGAMNFTKPRDPTSFSKVFARRAEAIGFGRVRFHDLRGCHATALLDAGIPVNRVAERIGDDPVTLLRSYTKRRRSQQADENLTSAIASLASGFLAK
jgi:integrase